MAAAPQPTDGGLSHHRAWFSGHDEDQATRWARQSVAEAGGDGFYISDVQPDFVGVKVLARWTETGPEAARRTGLMR